MNEKNIDNNEVKGNSDSLNLFDGMIYLIDSDSEQNFTPGKFTRFGFISNHDLSEAEAVYIKDIVAYYWKAEVHAQAPIEVWDYKDNKIIFSHGFYEKVYTNVETGEHYLRALQEWFVAEQAKERFSYFLHVINSYLVEGSTIRNDGTRLIEPMDNPPELRAFVDAIEDSVTHDNSDAFIDGKTVTANDEFPDFMTKNYDELTLSDIAALHEYTRNIHKEVVALRAKVRNTISFLEG